ncbi:two-component system response regulator NarL [Reinekea marinisedimentorum]|uniref:Two-component system nitrate/nitrite response regulator NarL n=1 Tax=Reinekea marinisedimentorum TaxID=230495 RepID=A0A4R3I371_9GAMM|nr:two-component system response regulator NarL [Reinekea marinisedimentorum]TCS40130.1 two-component system nitrate/nitrite response regulator NarL [Reinekea marinisedimentorum]
MADIIIVDDHPMLRKGLAQLFELEPEFHLVAELGNSKDALPAALKLDPDLILLDLNMPEQDGLTTLLQLRNNGITCRIIVFTVSDDQADIQRAIQNGADGYLLKDLDPEELVLAIKDCISGTQVLSPNIKEIARRAMRQRVAGTNTELESLTERERDVLKLIAEGQSNKVIGANLSIAEGTVKVHVKRVLSKLNLRSRVEAAIYAHDHINEL